MVHFKGHVQKNQPFHPSRTAHGLSVRRPRDRGAGTSTLGGSSAGGCRPGAYRWPSRVDDGADGDGSEGEWSAVPSVRDGDGDGVSEAGMDG